MTPSDHRRPRFLALVLGVAAIVGILATVPGCDDPTVCKVACAPRPMLSYEQLRGRCVCAPFPDGGSR